MLLRIEARIDAQQRGLSEAVDRERAHVTMAPGVPYDQVDEHVKVEPELCELRLCKPTAQAHCLLLAVCGSAAQVDRRRLRAAALPALVRSRHVRPRERRMQVRERLDRRKLRSGGVPLELCARRVPLRVPLRDARRVRARRHLLLRAGPPRPGVRLYELRRCCSCTAVL